MDWYQIAAWAVPVLIAVVLHELAHGWVALCLGDNTAKQAGRLSLNPLRHVDLMGTILIPALLIVANSPVVLGYAKPVPVNFARLNHPKRDMMLVAAAGPATNIVLLGLSAALLLSPLAETEWMKHTLQFSMMINAVLAIFNMWPIPPLDGSKVVAGIMPDRMGYHYMMLGRYGMLVVLLILLLPHIMKEFGMRPWPLAHYMIAEPALWLVEQTVNLISI